MKNTVHEDIVAALNALKEQYAEVDEPLPSEDELVQDEFSEINSSERPYYGGFSLALVPFSDWDEIDVSPLSKFGQPLWDFRCYPHVSATRAKINFDYQNFLDVNLIDQPYVHWLRIVKALIFYRIPKYSFSGLNKSYGGIGANRTKYVRLCSLFVEFGLYVNDGSVAPTKTLVDIDPEVVMSFIKKQTTPGMRWELAFAINYWQNLSAAGLLPPAYSISTEFVTSADVAKYRNEFEDSTAPYQPIPLDDFAEIVNYAALVVREYSQDILWLARTYYPTLVGKSQDRESEVFEGFSTGSEMGVRLFKEYSPMLLNGVPWWNLQVQTRKHPKDSGEYIPYEFVASNVAVLFDCCVTIIFATTGMRRSEVRALTADCISTDAAGHWLTFTVFKTSVASQGDKKKIPIPQITFDAIRLLQELCAHSRDYGKHGYLLSSLNRAFFGRQPNSVFSERSLRRVAEACGIDIALHSHRFRKSLAMYLIYQDSKNIEIIKHLFSHKSLRMTLKYILALPGVNQELKIMLVKQNADILASVLDAATSGRIGGKGGERIKNGLAGSKLFAARLHDRGMETLEQYVDSLLDQGIKLLHRTNLAFCLKSPTSHEVTPCNGKGEAPADRLHPNLFACDPFNCNYAVFTEEHAEMMSNEIVFHQGILKHPYCGTEQKTFSTRRIKEAEKRLAEVAPSYSSPEVGAACG